ERGELVPCLVGRLAAAEGVDRLARVRAKLVVGERPARRADDPEALGQEAGGGEVEEAGDELALREVAGRPEEHDHVVGGRAGGLTPGRGRSSQCHVDDPSAAARAAPSSAVLSLRITWTGIRSSRPRKRPLSTKARMNPPSRSRGRIRGGKPPPR